MASPSQQLPPGWQAEWYQTRLYPLSAFFIDKYLAGIPLLRDIFLLVREHA